DCSQYPKVLPGQETRSADDYELFLEGIMEAPRGPRDVCHGKVYVPAYRNDPSAGQFPCAGDDGRGHGRAGCRTCPGGAVSGAATPADWKTQAVSDPGPARQLPPAPQARDMEVQQQEQIAAPTPDPAPVMP